MSNKFAGRGDHSAATGYAVAVGACVIAVAIQYSLRPLLGQRFPLAALPAAVVVAAWFGGFGPGLLATLGGSLTAAYFYWGPNDWLRIDDPANAASLLIFTFLGFLISLAVRHVRRQAHLDRDARAEIERQLRHADRLQQLTATLSRAGTPAEVLQSGLPDLLYAVQAASGAVFLVPETGSGHELAQQVGYADSEGPSPALSAIVSSPLVRDVIQSREMAFLESDLEPDASDATVAVPLVAGGHALGAAVLSFSRRASVDANDSDVLLNAARHMAQALDRARLYELADRARAEAEALRARADSELRERHRAQEALRLSEARYRALAARTSRLYALNAGLSEAASPDAVAKVIVREGKVAVGASAASVALLVEGGARFQLLYAENYPAEEFEWRSDSAGEAGLCSGAAVETRCPVYIRSFAEWQERFPRSASVAADGGYDSAATLPLLSKGSVFGVMAFYFAVPVNFDDEYTTLLTSVALHCAQALDRACLYETAERARADAEAANRSKDDFLSTISHELRTPLNAILGWAAMLRQGVVDPDRISRAIESIFNNATRQGRLIEELLDVSRIVAGRVSLDSQEVDLAENIRGAVEAIMPLASAKGVELECEAAPTARVVADPRRLEQVFMNLLSNAVKFTPAGGRIRIGVTASKESIEVSVIDSGAGIDPTFLPHVFERFRQADSTTTRGVGGLGLGLFIARQLVEAQGGTIRVESEGVNRGAAFFVTLPAPSAAESAPKVMTNDEAEEDPESMPALDGLRVLIVDDEPDVREMMAAALEACGATIFTAASASQAMETLARTTVDLLLSDIAMPGQDGYELIRAVRALPSGHLASLPAAAVTARARDDERDLALAAGFQMHLTKPFHPAVLARAVANLAADSLAGR